MWNTFFGANTQEWGFSLFLQGTEGEGEREIEARGKSIVPQEMKNTCSQHNRYCPGSEFQSLSHKWLHAPALILRKEWKEEKTKEKSLPQKLFHAMIFVPMKNQKQPKNSIQQIFTEPGSTEALELWRYWWSWTSKLSLFFSWLNYFHLWGKHSISVDIQLRKEESLWVVG